MLVWFGIDALVNVCSLRMRCCADNWAARQDFIHGCYVIEAPDISLKHKESEHLHDTPPQNMARAPTMINALDAGCL